MNPTLSYEIDLSKPLLYRRVNMVASHALKFRVSVKDQGNPVDLDGYSIELYVWNAARAYEKVVPGALVTPAWGTAEIQVSDTDLVFPGNHGFLIRLEKDGEKSTSLKGDLVVHPTGTEIDYPTVFPGVWLDFDKFTTYSNVESSGPYQFGNRLTVTTKLNGGVLVEVDVADLEAHLAQVDQALDQLGEDLAEAEEAFNLALQDKVDTADVGQPGGVAPLDAEGKVPTVHIPIHTMISPSGNVWQLFVDDDGALVTNPLTPEE